MDLILKKALQSQEIKELLKPYIKPKIFYPIQASQPFDRLQIDLMDMAGTNNTYPTIINRGFRYIMCVIDVFTRKLYVRPTKTKGEKEILENFQKIFKEIKRDMPPGSRVSWLVQGPRVSQSEPILLDSDNESSFMSKSFKNYCEQNNITQNFVRPGDTRGKGVVERINLTLRRQLLTYTTYKKSKNWIDILDTIVDLYNNKQHSTLGLSPNEALEEKNYETIEKIFDDKRKLAEQKIGDLAVNTKVRLLKDKSGVEKKTSQNWTDETYTIDRQEGNNYYVEGKDNPYKKDQLLISTAKAAPRYMADTSQAQKKAKQLKETTIVTRKLNQEGLSQNNILSDSEKRPRKKPQRLDV